MKKSLYIAINFKQFIFSAIAIVVAFLFVFSLDLFYLHSSVASAENKALPTIIIDAGHGTYV